MRDPLRYREPDRVDLLYVRRLNGGGQGMSIIPDDFDLDGARDTHSTTPKAERKRCPRCGQSAILPLTGKGGAGVPSGHTDHEYRCEKCDNRFDDPVWGGSE